MLTALKVASFVLGFCLLAYALFAYQSEEKKVQSWVEAAGAALQKAEGSAASRIRALLALLMAHIDGILDRVYGRALFSGRAVAVPLFFFASLASFFGALSELVDGDGWSGVFLFIAGGVFLAYVPFSSKRWLFKVAAGLLIVCLVSAILLFALLTRKFWQLPAMVIAGIAIDLAAISAIRVFVRQASRAGGLPGTLFWMACVAPVGLVLGWANYRELAGELSLLTAILLPTWVAVLTAAAVVLLMAMALALRLLYTLAPRVIHSIQTFKVMENRKTLASIGVALMAVSIPELASPLGKWVGLVAR